MSRFQWRTLRIHRLAVAGLCATVALCWMCGSRVAAEPDKPHPAAGAPPAGRAEIAGEHIRRALRTPTRVNFVDTPLREGLEYLGKLHHIRIVPDAPKLAAEGVAMNTPITLSLKDVTLESALDLLLSPLQLDYIIKDEVLRVTTSAEERKTFQMEVYPVRDLLLDGGISPRELLDVLQEAVAPQSWDNEEAMLRIAKDYLLIVRQTPRAQRTLGHVLEQFREQLREPSMGAAAVGDEPQEPEEPGPSRKSVEAVQRIRRALGEPTEVDFVDTPLRECLVYLAGFHNIPIWANEQAMTDEGVAIDTPVTLSLGDMTLESALELLLNPLRLDFSIQDEVLQITTQAEAKQVFQVEMYTVRDLRDSGFSARDLTDVLTSSVAPKSWDNGQASLRIVRGNLLVVRQTPGIQRELVRALEKLRAGNRAQ